jgi:hypothetical protein
MEPEVRDEIFEIQKGLNRIGANVNQLVKLGHVGKMPWDENTQDFFIALRRDINMLSGTMASYVVASHRKATTLLKGPYDRLFELSKAGDGDWRNK